MRVRAVILLIACAFSICACSLITMRPPADDQRPYREPKCGGYAPPVIDTLAATAALAGAVVFSVLADTADFCEMGEQCYHITPGSAFGLAVGMSALALGFGLSACTGYEWSSRCGVVRQEHRKWGEAMYPALQVARVDLLRREKARHCRELARDWKKKIGTAGLQIKECRSFMREYRSERRMLAATTLHTAVERGEIQKLKELLSKHPNKNIQDRRGWTALHWAVQLGDRDALEALLAAGLDPDARDKHGAAPLHLAAFAGQVEIAVRLAGAGDVNARTKSGATPLHAAVLGAHADVVKVLLENGADAAARDSFGRTPAFYARIVQEPEIQQLLAR